MARDTETQARGRGVTRAVVRAAGHPASGGHSPYRNRISREPNVLPPQPQRNHPMDFQEYPKWLHFEGEASVLVQDDAAEAEVLAAKEATAKPAGAAKPAAKAKPE